MSDPETKLLAYVGRGLGSEPTTDLRNGRFVGWNRADKQVRLLPVQVVNDLMRRHPGQFALVDTMGDAAKRFSIKADRLAKLRALHTATYRKKGEEPQLVVILDAQTQAAIDAEHERAAKAKDKE